MDDVFPHSASWNGEDLRGNLTLLLTVEPVEPAACGFAYGISGTTTEHEVAALARNSLTEDPGLVRISTPKAETLGDRVEVNPGTGTWSLAQSGEGPVNSTFSVLISAFGTGGGPVERAPAWFDVGCSEDFELAIDVGSQHTATLSGGNFQGTAGASTNLFPADLDASIADRMWTQPTEQTIVILEAKTLSDNGSQMQGQLRLNTPNSTHHRDLSGSSMEPIRAEAGQGQYGLEVVRASANVDLYGIVAGVNSIGSSVDALDEWVERNASS